MSKIIFLHYCYGIILVLIRKRKCNNGNSHKPCSAEKLGTTLIKIFSSNFHLYHMDIKLYFQSRTNMAKFNYALPGNIVLNIRQ